MTHTAAVIRVLLVEPHRDTRELYARALIAVGWDVFAAADGISACDALRTLRPSIVVTETWLPEVDAVELLSASADAGIPVIALTTTGSEHDSTPGGMPFAAVLLKPCLPDELVRVVRQVAGDAAR
jgi:DNA-binding response OmpR family regulator